MIIFGTRGVTLTGDKGDFFCPECGPKTPFAKKTVRNFFTLYFIPLIPLWKAGEYVECSACKSTYTLKVLEFDPEAQSREFQSEFQKAVQKVMILMTIADGDVDDSEISAMAEIYKELSGHDISEEVLRRDVQETWNAKLSVQDYLKTVAGSLNEHGKEIVIQAMIRVAAADGHIDPEEEKLLEEAAKVLNLSKSHFRGILMESMPKAA